jgi:biotin carboxyl carrier protein
MRNIVKLGTSLAILVWLGSSETAFGQAGKAGAAGRAASTAQAVQQGVQTVTGTPATGAPNTTAPGSLVPNPNNVVQQATQPGQPATTAPAAAAANPQQSPVNPAAATTNTRTVAPGTINYGPANTNTYSSYYVPAYSPGATMSAPGVVGTALPGTNYTYVNPMGVTPAPGYYYSGQPGGLFGRRTTYSSMYVTPGTTVTPGQTYYYTTPTQTYVTRPRRGLFGGLFRRNRQVYTSAPYGYTYSSAPGTYYYTTTPGTY